MLQTHFQNEWAGLPCNTYAEHVTAALKTTPKGGGFIKLPKMLLVAFQLSTCVNTLQPGFSQFCVPVVFCKLFQKACMNINDSY